MKSNDLQRTQEILLAVVDLPPEERDARLGALCAGDEELRREVESLLSYAADSLPAVVGAPAMRPPSAPPVANGRRRPVRLTLAAAVALLAAAGGLWLGRMSGPPLETTAATAQAYRVRPDGHGDFPSLRVAIESAASGDTLLLGNGVFVGPDNRNLDLDGKDLVIMARSGDADSCVIDCQASPDRPAWALRFASGETREALLAGVTVCNACSPEGGAAIMIVGSGPTLRHCIFRSNQAGGEATSADGGVVLATGGANPSIENCCFWGNEAGNRGGALCLRESSALVTNCSFVGGRGGSAVHAGPGAAATIERCLIAFNDGPSITRRRSVLILRCCDLFGNRGGDWPEPIADQQGRHGNFSLDPLLCDRETGSLVVGDESPCLPENNPCLVFIGVTRQNAAYREVH